MKYPILLLTSIRTDGNGIGTIFLRDILESAPEFSVHWYVVEPFMLEYIRARSGFVWRALNAIISRIGIFNDIRLYLYQNFKIHNHVKSIEKAFKASAATKIWVTTSSPELICVAQALSKRGYDIRVTVWDAPEYFIQNLRMSKRSEEQVLNRFWSLLHNSRVCSVISTHMQKEYAKQVPKLPIVLMRHGIAPLNTPKKFQESKKPIRIVFAGSLYSKNEWNSFVTALEELNWNVKNREIQLEFIGLFPLKGVRKPVNLKIHPPMSQKDVLEFISHADIGYLPYWLKKEKIFIAKSSFPGKMTAYSAAGLAIFHHGPDSSSVTDFLNKYNYGVACNSLQSEIIVERLKLLISCMNSNSMKTARRIAMDNELSDAVMLRQFRTLVS